MSKTFDAAAAARWLEEGLAGNRDDLTIQEADGHLRDIVELLKEAAALKDFRDWHCRTSDEGYMRGEKV